MFEPQYSPLVADNIICHCLSTVAWEQALPAAAYIGIVLEDIAMAEGTEGLYRESPIQPGDYEREGGYILPLTLLSDPSYRYGSYRHGFIRSHPDPGSFRVSASRYESIPPHPILYPDFLKRLKGTFPRAAPSASGSQHNCSSVSRVTNSTVTTIRVVAAANLMNSRLIDGQGNKAASEITR